VPRHLVRAQPPLAAEHAGDAVLVLQPEDAAIHSLTLCASPLPRGRTHTRQPEILATGPATSPSARNRANPVTRGDRPSRAAPGCPRRPDLPERPGPPTRPAAVCRGNRPAP